MEPEQKQEITSDNRVIEEEKKLRIAIVGAGIAGCASAYLLKTTLGNKIDEIVVFEKNDRVGGRLATFEFDGREYEIGGAILHSSNLYMKKFMEICDLKKVDEPRSLDDYFGLFDAYEILFECNGKYFGIFDKIRLFKYFGLFQLMRFKKWITSLTNSFGRIYKLQEDGFAFTNLEEFLTKLDPKLYEMSQKSLRKSLEEMKFNDELINKLSSIACLTNYGQSVDIDGFVGMVSLAGTIGDIFRVKNGVKQVPAGLVEKSQARLLLSARVKSISKSPTEPDSKNQIVYQIAEGEEVTDSLFDYVLIAFPIYKGIIGPDFQLEFAKPGQFEDKEMKQTNMYMINGTVKLFANLPDNKRLQLHSVDPEVLYRTICAQLPCNFSKNSDHNMFLKKGPKLYKIFSYVNLGKNTFDKIFEEGYEVKDVVPWLAYPKYQENPTEKYIPNVILDSNDTNRSRVFYLNAMEWSSSCMEIESISAKNVTNLIWQKENSKTKKPAVSNSFFVVKEKKKIKKFFTESDYMENERFQTYLHKFCGWASFFFVSAFLVATYFRLSSNNVL